MTLLPLYEERTEGLTVFEAEALSFLPHLHTHLELVYMEQGACRVTVGQEEAVLREGGLAAVFPGCVHSYKPEEEPARCLVLIAGPHLAGEYRQDLLSCQPRCPLLGRERLNEDVPHALCRLLHMTEEGDEAPAVSRAYLQIILARLWPYLELEPGAAPYRDLARRVVSYILENYQKSMTLETAAQALGVSKCHLSRVFSQKLHTGFNEYLNHIRVNYARELLRSTDRTVTEIAYDCGFDSPRTFNRAFLKVYGENPRACRRAAGR